MTDYTRKVLTITKEWNGTGKDKKLNIKFPPKTNQMYFTPIFGNYKFYAHGCKCEKCKDVIS